METTNSQLYVLRLDTLVVFFAFLAALLAVVDLLLSQNFSTSCRFFHQVNFRAKGKSGEDIPQTSSQCKQRYAIARDD